MLDVGSRLLRRGDYIWGSFVRPSLVDGYIVGVNPGDRADTLGEFAIALRSVDDAMGAAREAAVDWAATHVDERRAAVTRFREVLDEAGDAVATLITRETGKPLWEAHDEVHATLQMVKRLDKDAGQRLAPQVLREGVAWSEPRPYGVVGVITPYVMPVLVPVTQILAAIVAGNTVVFKPSKFAPGCGQAVAELVDRCRLPRGVVNLVQGHGAGVGQRIATHPGLDALLFTGSWETARNLRRTLLGRPELPVRFACGGKGNAIVLPDADLDLAAHEIALGAWATAGQRPDSTARAFVVEEVFDALSERLVRLGAGLSVGYGFDDDVFMGPMVSDVHRERVRQHAADLGRRGHRALLETGSVEVGGRRGFYVRPGLVWMSGAEDLLDAEPPGPILHLHAVSDAEHAWACHARLPSRVSTSVFCGSEGRVEEAMRRLDTGRLLVNRATIASSARLSSVGRGRAALAGVAGVDLLHFLAPPAAVTIDRRPMGAGRAVPGMPTPERDDAPTVVD